MIRQAITLMLLLPAMKSCDSYSWLSNVREFSKQTSEARIVGTWNVDADRSLQDISEIPRGLSRKFTSLDDYRAYVRPKIVGGQFEIHADGTALYRTSTQTFPKMTWEQNGEKYWVGYQGFIAASVGHIFEVRDNGTGICKFQVEYSESVAPRSPLYISRVKK